MRSKEKFVKSGQEPTGVPISKRAKSKMTGYNGDVLHCNSPGGAMTHPGQDPSLYVKDILDLISIPNITELMGFRCFNICFRFFPPLLLLRWSVDFWLIICEAVLALLTDHSRVAYRSLQATKTTVAYQNGKSKCIKPTSDSCERFMARETVVIQEAGADSKKPRRTTPGRSVTCNGPRVSTPRVTIRTDYKQSPIVTNCNGRHQTSLNQAKAATPVRKGSPQVQSPKGDDGARHQTSMSHGIKTAVLCFRLFLLYLITACLMPLLRRAIILLSHLSHVMHSLAGVEEFDDQEEKNQRVFLYTHLLRQLPDWLGKDISPGSVPQIGPDEWLTSHLVVRLVHEMSKYPCLKSSFLQTIVNKNRRLSVVETAKALVMQIQEESFVDLPSYLASDQEYDEDEDSNYVQSDDSSSEECDTEESLDDEAVDLLVSMCENSDKKAILKDIIKMKEGGQEDCPKKDLTQRAILHLMDLLKLQEQVTRQRSKLASKEGLVPEKPTGDKTLVDQSTTVKCIVEEPTMEKLNTEKPISEKPIMDEPTTLKPIGEEPTLEKLTMEKLIVGQPDMVDHMNNHGDIEIQRQGLHGNQTAMSTMTIQ